MGSFLVRKGPDFALKGLGLVPKRSVLALWMPGLTLNGPDLAGRRSIRLPRYELP
jgi:hypothetical protein